MKHAGENSSPLAVCHHRSRHSNCVLHTVHVRSWRVWAHHYLSWSKWMEGWVKPDVKPAHRPEKNKQRTQESVKCRQGVPTKWKRHHLRLISAESSWPLTPTHLFQRTPLAAGRRCRAAAWAGGQSPGRPEWQRCGQRLPGAWTASPPPAPPAAPPPQTDPRGASASSWWWWHKAPPHGPRCRRCRTPPNTCSTEAARRWRVENHGTLDCDMYDANEFSPLQWREPSQAQGHGCPLWILKRFQRPSALTYLAGVLSVGKHPEDDAALQWWSRADASGGRRVKTRRLLGDGVLISLAYRHMKQAGFMLLLFLSHADRKEVCSTLYVCSLYGRCCFQPPHSDPK